MAGWTDLPADLSDVAALARLSQHLPHAPIISSDLTRAVDTANAIQDTRPRLPHSQHIREINFGIWENRTFKDVEAETPKLLRNYWEDPGIHAPAGGESWNQVDARVSTFVDRFSHDQNDIIAVAHMGTILTQVRRARNESAYEAFAQKIHNLSVTCLEVHDGHWTVHSVNHLP
jgi:broad specificity phosphatase PhoE